MSSERWNKAGYPNVDASMLKALLSLMGLAGVDLSIQYEDAATNTVVYVSDFAHLSTGTPAAGFGVGHEWVLENAAGESITAATEEVTWTDATDASEDSEYRIKTIVAGALWDAMVLENKRMGVNTNAPESALHVATTSAADQSRNLRMAQHSADAVGAVIAGYKSRNATIGSHTVVQSGDVIATFGAFASDGSAWVQGGALRFEVDGTPGASDMPTRLLFMVTADGASSPTEAGRITNAKRWGIGETSPDGKLHIDQSDASGAIPDLVLEQQDVDVAFIKFVGSGTNNDITRSIVDNGDYSAYAVEGFVKVYVQDDGNRMTDGNYFIPVCSLSS